MKSCQPTKVGDSPLRGITPTFFVISREDRRCPKYITDALAKAGGLNPYGKPRWIVVWGGSFTQQLGGMWKQADGTTFIDQLKDYFPYKQDRWHLMKWQPCDKTEAEWNEDRQSGSKYPLGGKYPDKGWYMHSTTFEGQNGEYRELSRNLLVTLLGAINFTYNFTEGERQAAIRANQEKKEKDEDRIMDDKMDDVLSGFGSNKIWSSSWGHSQGKSKATDYNLAKRVVDKLGTDFSPRVL